MGEAGEHHSPPVLGSVQVLVNAFEREHLSYSPPQTYLHQFPEGANLLTSIPRGGVGNHVR